MQHGMRLMRGTPQVPQSLRSLQHLHHAITLAHPAGQGVVQLDLRPTVKHQIQRQQPWGEHAQVQGGQEVQKRQQHCQQCHHGCPGNVACPARHVHPLTVKQSRGDVHLYGAQALADGLNGCGQPGAGVLQGGGKYCARLAHAQPVVEHLPPEDAYACAHEAQVRGHIQVTPGGVIRTLRVLLPGRALRAVVTCHLVLRKPVVRQGLGCGHGLVG